MIQHLVPVRVCLNCAKNLVPAHARLSLRGVADRITFFKPWNDLRKVCLRCIGDAQLPHVVLAGAHNAAVRHDYVGRENSSRNDAGPCSRMRGGGSIGPSGM